jgi:hypothetical protein
MNWCAPRLSPMPLGLRNTFREPSHVYAQRLVIHRQLQHLHLGERRSPRPRTKGGQRSGTSAVRSTTRTHVAFPQTVTARRCCGGRDVDERDSLEQERHRGVRRRTTLKPAASTLYRQSEVAVLLEGAQDRRTSRLPCGHRSSCCSFGESVSGRPFMRNGSALPRPGASTSA